jgi:sulfite exporter TauE/SafE
MDVSVFIIVILIGIVGGFTHCIGMCGPFAINISGIRLMNASKVKASKFQALFALPYYVGKALSYTTIAVVFFYTSSVLQKIPGYNIVAFILLLFVSCLFLVQAVGIGFELININSRYAKIIESAFKAVLKPKHNQYGINGFLTGYILGFIPCGMVILVITLINTSFDNILSVALATFLFGLSTTPALFLIGSAGVVGQKGKFKKAFKIGHSILMIFCAYLTFVYALKVI